MKVKGKAKGILHQKKGNFYITSEIGNAANSERNALRPRKIQLMFFREAVNEK